MPKARWILASAVPIAGASFYAWSAMKVPAPEPAEAAIVIASARPSASASAEDDGGGDPNAPVDEHEDDRTYVFRMPSGEPTNLTCDEARTIVDQVRSGLAYPPETVPPNAFATSTSDWLDPHGLLSLSKDAPTERAIGRVSSDLIADLEGRRKRDCSAADAPGAALDGWSNELRDAFDHGRKQAKGSASDADSAALEPLPPTALAREVAFEIGRRAGAFEAGHPDGKPYADEARRRFFPPLGKDGWARVVLASAVRAYVPLVDPHGEWAPFDEESRIYEVDLAARPPSRLWSRAVPTAVGVRVTDGAAKPLAQDDVVLAIGKTSTAGLPLEQVDQIGFAASDAKVPLTAIVLRKGKIVALPLGKADETGRSDQGKDAPGLPLERIPYGDGDVLVIAVKDVRDDLGDELADEIEAEREATGTSRHVTGVVIDLRGNGGGSTDGALGALSLFLPGAPLFSMKRRDGTIEVDRAPVPRERDRWNGPVATLVDATTASAAEMIAGGLASYKRGPVVGTTTFGKGCAQEYVDDDAHAGVLRLTTLVYALADGTPVQRLGLTPQIRFPFVPEDDDDGPLEREAKLAHSAPPWRGPDLRDASLVKPETVAWPSNGGNVGPCKDADVCRAIRLLGGPKRAPVAKH